MTRRLRTGIAGLIAASLLPLATLASPAAATTTNACPEGDVPPAGFGDTAGNAHARSIDCAVWWGVAGGTSSDSFGPGGTLTRAQLASMLARLVGRAGLAPTTVIAQGFTDTEQNGHASNIDMMAQLGVVGGYADGTFRPAAVVTRAQVASMLVRLHSNVFDGTFPTGEAAFEDVEGNVHRDAIQRLVAAGITRGMTPTTFAPGGSVTRAQMATFVMRHVDLLVADGVVTTPAAITDPPPAGADEPSTTPAPQKGESGSPCIVEDLLRSMFHWEHRWAEEGVMDNGVGRHCHIRVDGPKDIPPDIHVGVDAWERVLPAESIASMYSGEDLFVGDIGIGNSAVIQHYAESTATWIYVELGGTTFEARLEHVDLPVETQAERLTAFARAAIPLLWPDHAW